MPLPLLPLQILYLNLITDVFPAFALGIGEGEANVLNKPPRPPAEPILGRTGWLAIAGYGTLITVATLAAFVLALTQFAMSERHAVTVSFLTLALAQLWHVFNMRERGSGLLNNEIMQNPYIWGALAVCIALILVAIHVPVLAATLGLAAPGVDGWLLACGASFVPLLVGQIGKTVRS